MDDVSYGGEPVFADGGVVANGVDDVAAVGVSYFSSAANSYGVSVYNSDLRIVPNGTGVTAATNTALVGHQHRSDRRPDQSVSGRLPQLQPQRPGRGLPLEHQRDRLGRVAMG